MLQAIDTLLNSVTMYRAVLYGLIFLAIISHIFGATGVLDYSFFQQLISLFVLGITCYVSNWVFSKLFKAPTNVESSILTALILFFLLIPISSLHDIRINLTAGIIAMASKYFFTYNQKHIFNPAAFSVFILGLLGIGSTIWWVGSSVLLPFVLITGLLIVRKIRRFSLFISFTVAAVIMITFFNIKNGLPVLPNLIEVFLSWPIIFFGTIMLTEPLTLPPTKKLQVIYGSIVGVVFGSQFAIGPIYSTPELALLVGNIFSFVVSPRLKLFLTLQERNKVAHDTYEFIFKPQEAYTFRPGQYMEWTFPHMHPDNRGNRRYFTIASSPTEAILRLIIRIEAKASSYKQNLLKMTKNEKIVASQLAGDFVLPTDAKEKLVFIAGGIGITPFLSMIQYLVDKNENRDITLFYVNKKEADIVFKSLFDTAQKIIGLKTHYVLTGIDTMPKNWKGLQGRINQEMIKQCVPHCQTSLFYLSGPNAMVDATKKMLIDMGIARNNIKTDYFPGF